MARISACVLFIAGGVILQLVEGVNVCITGQAIKDVLLTFNPPNTTALSCSPNGGDTTVRQLPSEIGLYPFVEAINFARITPTPILGGTIPTDIGNIEELRSL